MNGSNYGAAAQCDTASGQNKLHAVESTTDVLFGRMVNVQSTTLDLLATLDQRLSWVLTQEAKGGGTDGTSPAYPAQLHNELQSRIESAEWINARLSALIDRVCLQP